MKFSLRWEWAGRSVLTNRKRPKYVDDTTAFEIIPRNSISVLDIVVREIHDYCIEHKMKLNPKKCKEMYVDFMKNSITTLRPISIGNKEVERV